MLSDIEIAQRAKMKDINEIAKMIGLDSEGIEPYGHYKAKISNETLEALKDKDDGKLLSILLRQARERQLFLSVFHRLLISLAKRLLPHLENLHSVLFLALKAVPQAADILR